MKDQLIIEHDLNVTSTGGSSTTTTTTGSIDQNSISNFFEQNKIWIFILIAFLILKK